MIPIEDWSDAEIQQALEDAKRRGIAVSMLPHPSEDRLALGIDRDRSKWTADARERYDGLEKQLPSFKALATVEASKFTVALTPAASIPSTWFQHLKLTLRERWPRLFGWLDVRWRR